MITIKIAAQIFFAVTGSIAALLSILLFFSFRWPAPFLWISKIVVSALSPVLALLGLVTFFVGLTTGSIFISLIGTYVVVAYTIHIISVTRPPAFSNGFEQAFGPNWTKSFQAEQKKYFLPSRAALRLPAVPKPQLEQNVSFATIPGTGRELLCDIWHPSKSVRPSGLTLIYLFGSAWYMLDKDFGTRPFFKHLAAQGHVIMDVAYRLAPETDMMGMVHDVKRAVVWMKEHAGIYGIDATRIIVSGGSAGAHLALMTAYTSDDPKFTPAELVGKDCSVCAVISLYGQADLEAMYYHTSQHLTTRSIPGKYKKAVPTKMPDWTVKALGKDYHRLGFDKDFLNSGSMATLLGGHPDEAPECYALFSPITHVHPNCPPTLLIHGEHDIMAPVTAIRRLHSRLMEARVPTVLHILPQADHAFDLILPKISPAAHNAIYDAERFLSVMVRSEPIVASRSSAIDVDPLSTSFSK
jgi:acetyl esterase/lipase